MSWTERLHRQAACLGTAVTSCRPVAGPYPSCLEKVRFDFPLEQVCKDNIPGPLLVLILKLNKEAPYRKDVFRAPGHQNNIKKLIHFLQNGRLVNLANFSIHTIASVIKQFLRRIPEGIFGPENERLLFEIIGVDDPERRRDSVHRLMLSLPVHTQQLLVLLFGTFRVIATHAERSRTGMTSEALGVSAAPSFFRSCVAGQVASREDVARFKVAMRIMMYLIDNFGISDLFGRANYEFYARVTGRILRVDHDWIFSFRYPPDGNVAPLTSRDTYRSTPARLHVRRPNSPLTDTESDGCSRLSASLDSGVCQAGDMGRLSGSCALNITLEELRCLGQHSENTRLTAMVRQRQTDPMRTRSDWLLTPLPCDDAAASAVDTNSVGRTERRASGPEQEQRASSRSGPDRWAVRRTASRCYKENGAAPPSATATPPPRSSLGDLPAAAAYRPRL